MPQSEAETPVAPVAPEAGETTGRYIVTMREGEHGAAAAMKALRSATGARSITRTADMGTEAIDADALKSEDVIVLDAIGIAIVSGDPTKVGAFGLMASEDNGILAIEPERIMYALSDGGASSEYVRGYRDGVSDLSARLGGGAGGGGDAGGGESGVEQTFADTPTVTWGLQATRVLTSALSGRGISVAVLDTGFDLTHPDFQGRRVFTKSFIAGEPVQDRNGHGTHCIGTSCGPKAPPTGRRYGIAYEATIFAGKVLSNAGSGADAGILAGIDWAIRNRCQVISMSLGAPTQLGEPFSVAYETVGQRALANGTLIVAAAGNESDRRVGRINPVGRPANCPSLMAVAALDPNLGVSFFSCGGLNPNGGNVDIAAPGRDVYSTWFMPTRYRTISGTSMATPHVAGIAALYAQSNAQLRGRALWQALSAHARRLPLPSRDVGIGLVQAI